MSGPHQGLVQKAESIAGKMSFMQLSCRPIESYSHIPLGVEEVIDQSVSWSVMDDFGVLRDPNT